MAHARPSETSDMVRDWVQSQISARPPGERLARFEQSLEAVWRRARRTLATVTLQAVLERILVLGNQRFHWLMDLKVDPDGHVTGLRQPEAEADIDEAITWLLSEFLRIIGELTAGILTPVLFSELERVKDLDLPLSTTPRKENPHAS